MSWYWNWRDDQEDEGSQMSKNGIYVTITADDESAGTSVARFLESKLREAGAEDFVQLAPKVQDRKLGVFPSEAGRLRDLLAKLKVTVVLSVRR